MRCAVPSCGGRGRWRARPTDLLILAAAAWSSPLQIWANNPVGINHPHRLLLVGLVPWAIAVGSQLLAERLGARRGTALTGAFLMVLMVMRGGPLVSAYGTSVALVSVASIAGITAYLISRRANQAWVLVGLVACSILLAAGPLESFITSKASLGTDKTGPRPADLDVELVSTPHIFIVVTDGYAGKVTLRRDFGVVEPDWKEMLTARGFETPRSAWTSYATTKAALPSLLDMSYPIESGPGVDPATLRTLYEMNGGANRLVAELKRNGYRFVMVESGWGGSSCEPVVDECVVPPFVDEATFAVLHRTVFRGVMLKSVGYAFGIGTQHTIAWLIEHSGRISASPTPHLVYAHLMIPHPPFFLDSSCQHRYKGGLSGLHFGDGPWDEDQRKQAYLEQASCVDHFFGKLVDQVSDDVLVVLISDHGSDIRDQLRRHPTTWDESDLIERMNILLAVRATDGCSLGDQVVMPNVMRRLLSCISDQEINDLEPRMFMLGGGHDEGERSAIVEVDPSVVRSMVADLHE